MCRFLTSVPSKYYKAIKIVSSIISLHCLNFVYTVSINYSDLLKSLSTGAQYSSALCKYSGKVGFFHKSMLIIY